MKLPVIKLLYLNYCGMIFIDGHNNLLSKVLFTVMVSYHS